ncbi:MAG TPA: Na-translocating system protein MpsC family protein [Solirubrobacteraceae bacterium]|nr:Na-translocating system protein MpsC family protein [Solirubrobacteraceae bacterium]
MVTRVEDRSRDLPPTDHPPVLAQISNACVRLHKRFHGKGPVRARAELWGDVLIVLLEDGFTRAEQTLQERGHTQEVVDARLAMRSSIEGEIRAVVEAILARPVRSYMSATDPAARLQVEVFLLQ